MFDGARHEMELERTHPSGAQEWFCPTCGRRLLMQWPPNYKKIVLAPGDEQAYHAGGSVSLGMAQPPAGDELLRGEALPAADPAPVDLADEPDPHEPPPPWLKWLDDYDPSAG